MSVPRAVLPTKVLGVHRVFGGARSAGLALVAAVVLAASSAHADSYDEALREGVSARDRARETGRISDWQNAVQQFERAVVARDTVEARFELAEAATELQNVAVAYESYELSLRGGLSGKAAEIASAFIDAHEDEVARLELIGPAGSSVFVNGERRARLPLTRPLVVPAGRVRLRLVSPQEAPWEKAVDFDAQVVMRLAPDLSPKLAPEPAWDSEKDEPSWVGEHPGAIALISIAGVSLVAGGAFAVAYDTRDDAANDKREQIMSALQEHVANGYFSPSTVPCGSNGVAGGQVVFEPSLSPVEQQSLVTDYANACEKFDQDSDSADRYRTLALVGFGVGAVATAAVLTWYLTDSGGEPPEVDRAASAPRLVPILTADTQGLLLDLRF